MARKLHKKPQLPKYTSRGCTLTKNYSKWCNRDCTPNPDGYGHCGRLAPHAMKSRLQLAIQAYKDRQEAMKKAANE